MPTAGFRASGSPRYRVIADNDYAGDPDGLFQLAHHALSPSVDLRAVIGSHLAPGDPFDASGHSAAHGANAARTVLDLVSRADVPVIAGTEVPLTSADTPRPSPAAAAIVAEAMRSDTDLPLYLVLGAGLTELASAYLMEPAIADRLTAVWIGGPEYLDLGAVPPPNASPVEYNLNIDLMAGRVVFDSSIPLWQVPRNAYRECIASMSELMLRVKPRGAIGAHLYQSLVGVFELMAPLGRNLGEVYVLGDSPLVLLTALQTGFEPDPSSSRYAVVPRPRIGADGAYEANPDGAPVRVYSGLDVRLMLEDLYAKLELASAGDADQVR